MAVVTISIIIIPEKDDATAVMRLLSIRLVHKQSFRHNHLLESVLLEDLPVIEVIVSPKGLSFFIYYSAILETFLYEHAWEIVICKPTK